MGKSEIRIGADTDKFIVEAADFFYVFDEATLNCLFAAAVTKHSFVTVHDGKVIFINMGNRLEVWDIATKQRIKDIGECAPFVKFVSIQNNILLIGCGDKNGSLYAYDMTTWERLYKKEGQNPLLSLDIVGNSRKLICSVA